MSWKESEVMLDSITKAAFKDILDKADFHYLIDRDGDFTSDFSSDDDFSRSVQYWFIVNEEKSRIAFLADAEDYVLSDDELPHALIKCNEWNEAHNVGIAYVDMKMKKPRFSAAMFIDEPISEEYIVGNFIKLFPSLAWKFFCSLED
jgi:hypothetical protein